MQLLTVNMLTMRNVAPRGKEIGDCVIKALTFICRPSADYSEVESLVMREQFKYNPNAIKTGGVSLFKLLGAERKLFGKHFQRVAGLSPYQPILPQNFLHRHLNGVYVVQNHNHAYVVKHGEIFDANPTKGSI